MTIKRDYLYRENFIKEIQGMRSYQVPLGCSYDSERPREGFSLRIFRTFVVEGDAIFPGEPVVEIIRNFTDKPDHYAIKDIAFSRNSGVVASTPTVGETISEGDCFTIGLIPDSELNLNLKRLRTYFSPFTGSLSYEEYSNRKLAQLDINGIDLGSFDRVVESINVVQNKIVHEGEPLFVFFPVNPGSDVLAQYEPEFEFSSKKIIELKSEISGLKKKKKKEEEGFNVLKKEIAKKSQEMTDDLEKSRIKAIRAAEKEASNISNEATNELQRINDDAEKLELTAVIERLYALMAQGETATILELPQLRALYLKLGELAAVSQGVPAPETAARMAAFNKIDDMKAIYAYVSETIGTLDPEGKWPEDVRQAAIRDFSDLAKGQAHDQMNK